MEGQDIELSEACVAAFSTASSMLVMYLVHQGGLVLWYFPVNKLKQVFS